MDPPLSSNHDDDDNDYDDDNDNPYLALRRQKIARNQARLKELGLLSPPPLPSNKPTTSRSSRKKKVISTTITTEPIIVRRSKRISKQQQEDEINDDDDDAANNDDGEISSSNKKRLRRRQQKESLSSSSSMLLLPASSPLLVEPSSNYKRKKTVTTTHHRQPSVPAPNSVRLINLDINLLVMGGCWKEKTNNITTTSTSSSSSSICSAEENNDNDNNNNNNNTTTTKSILGIPMAKTGKEFVIYESFYRAASNQYDRDRMFASSKLSFNKYSGVQEWSNVIFLWVNLGSPKSDVVNNEFLLDGQQITWFGGSRMYEDSSIIQKLIQYGHLCQDNDNNNNNDNDNDNNNVTTTTTTSTSISTTTNASSSKSKSKIILWCRRYNPTTKSFEPYVCLGRLSYHSHIPNSYPIKFIWNLLDYEQLINSTNNNVVKEQFQLCLDVSSASSYKAKAASKAVASSSK